MTKIEAVHIILFVSDQQRSTEFFRKTLAVDPRLNVPGMSEFQLTPTSVLGLMPKKGIRQLLKTEQARSESRSHALALDFKAECYLIVEDAEICVSRALAAGAELLSPLQSRDWGHRVGYCRDLDGYILAFAEIETIKS